MLFFVRLRVQERNTVIVAIRNIDSSWTDDDCVGMTAAIRSDAVLFVTNKGTRFDDRLQAGGRWSRDIKDVDRRRFGSVRVAKTRNGVVYVLVNVSTPDAFRVTHLNRKIAGVNL